MIRLTDKEISRIEGQVLADIKPDEHIQSRVMREVAKVQLRKVVEWGSEDCLHLPGPYSMRKRACDECWQSLLEEVKE